MLLSSVESTCCDIVRGYFETSVHDYQITIIHILEYSIPQTIGLCISVNISVKHKKYNAGIL